MSQSERPVVAVGVPCYNRPEMLDQCLRSLRAQTYPALSILISDNASTDPGVEAVGRRHAAEDARVRYVRQERNVGMVANFEYVLVNSNAPYFMWASDDDWHEPDFVERCVDCLEKEGESVVSVVTEARLEMPDGTFEFFNQGEAFRTFRSDSAAERLAHTIWHNYSIQFYSVHRRSALFHDGRPLTYWWGKARAEHSMIFMFAGKGNTVTLPGASFHKRTRRINCELLKWAVYGGWFPKKKIRQRATRLLKHLRKVGLARQDHENVIEALKLDEASKAHVGAALDRTSRRDTWAALTGWQAPQDYVKQARQAGPQPQLDS